MLIHLFSIFVKDIKQLLSAPFTAIKVKEKLKYRITSNKFKQTLILATIFSYNGPNQELVTKLLAEKFGVDLQNLFRITEFWNVFGRWNCKQMSDK